MVVFERYAALFARTHEEVMGNPVSAMRDVYRQTNKGLDWISRFDDSKRKLFQHQAQRLVRVISRHDDIFSQDGFYSGLSGEEHFHLLNLLARYVPAQPGDGINPAHVFPDFSSGQVVVHASQADFVDVSIISTWITSYISGLISHRVGAPSIFTQQKSSSKESLHWGDREVAAQLIDKFSDLPKSYQARMFGLGTSFNLMLSRKTQPDLDWMNGVKFR